MIFPVWQKQLDVTGEMAGLQLTWRCDWAKIDHNNSDRIPYAAIHNIWRDSPAAAAISPLLPSENVTLVMPLSRALRWACLYRPWLHLSQSLVMAQSPKHVPPQQASIKAPPPCKFSCRIITCNRVSSWFCVNLEKRYQVVLPEIRPANCSQQNKLALQYNEFHQNGICALGVTVQRHAHQMGIAV